MEKESTELSATAEGTCSSDKAQSANVGNTGQLESRAAVGEALISRRHHLRGTNRKLKERPSSFLVLTYW